MSCVVDLVPHGNCGDRGSILEVGLGGYERSAAGFFASWV